MNNEHAVIQRLMENCTCSCLISRLKTDRKMDGRMDGQPVLTDKNFTENFKVKVTKVGKLVIFSMYFFTSIPLFMMLLTF